MVRIPWPDPASALSVRNVIASPTATTPSTNLYCAEMKNAKRVCRRLTSYGRWGRDHEWGAGASTDAQEQQILWL
jgi:hypothetical protein